MVLQVVLTTKPEPNIFTGNSSHPSMGGITVSRQPLYKLEKRGTFPNLCYEASNYRTQRKGGRKGGRGGRGEGAESAHGAN